MQSAEVGSIIAITANGRQQALPAQVAGLPETSDSDWKDAALQKPLNFAAKRMLDIVVSASALLFLLPVFLVVAAAIKWESKGPVFFLQDRWGRGGRLIRIFKFRCGRICAMRAVWLKPGATIRA